LPPAAQQALELAAKRVSGGKLVAEAQAETVEMAET